MADASHHIFGPEIETVIILRGRDLGGFEVRRVLPSPMTASSFPCPSEELRPACDKAAQIRHNARHTHQEQQA